MTENLYFSEREIGEKARDQEAVSQNFWRGFNALVTRLHVDGSLAERFPRYCPENFVEGMRNIFGCDEEEVEHAFAGEHPDVKLDPEVVPPLSAVLDAVEFFWRIVSEPRLRRRHDYFAHEHLSRFDQRAGQERYRDAVNTLFRRNGHPYELRENGTAIRIGPPILSDLMANTTFRTGDGELDKLLSTASEKFGSPKLDDRKDALEKLWDAFERLKTLEDPQKPAGIQMILSAAVKDNEFRSRIEAEMKELTKLGNDFQIRHFETTKIPIETSEQIDYLFHRMFTLIWLLLRSTGRTA